MKRRLFTILSALSLLLCVGTVVLWVRSYGTKDAYSGSDGIRMQGLLSHRGWISWSVQHLEQEGQSWPWGWSSKRANHLASAEITLPSWQQAWGVGWETYESSTGGLSARGVSLGVTFRFSAGYVAHRVLALLFLLLPAVWGVGILRSRCVRSRGGCPSCDYDLRATPGRCPECDAVPAKVLS